MSVPTPRWSKLLLALLVLVALVVALRLDMRAVWSALRGARPVLLGFAVLVNLGAIVAQALRWRAILRSRSPVTRREAFAGYVLGLWFSSLLPARLGEVVRIRLVSARSGLPIATVTGSVLTDHLLNGFSLVPLLAPLLWLPGVAEPLRRAVAAALMLIVSALLVAWLVAAEGRSEAIGRIWVLLRNLRDGLAVMRSKRRLVAALGWSLAAWVGEVAMMALSLKAFGIGLPLHAAVVVLVAVNAAMLLPAAPANLGTFEVAATLALAGFGVQREAALVFALGYHALHVASAALMAGITWPFVRKWAM